MTNIERFEELMKRVQRPGIDKLMDYVRKSDFYTAPASTKFHLSVPGGLLQHSLNVYDVLMDLLKHNEDGTYSYVVAGQTVMTLTEENVIIMALLHDICKTYFYKPMEKWRKDENNKWQSYLGYEIEDKMPLGHGEKSAFILDQYITLETCERYAIRWHMGYPSEGEAKYSFQAAITLKPVVWALHTADVLASSLMEDKEGNTEMFTWG